ncbi:MAG: 3-deoxy-7-phosphoheptulonate synthase [Nitrospirae bacterium CG_4_10_14_3_um_filter_44_29]|nr:3-deoxy-7-phosphoheptulonate synthase [Nitrospirota bacterium]OIO29554.1 MAG: 3-deoxy-7-phosphoheptulonate synthase [Nitrospirae bacterium CG1_02_44_142]PIP71373.1 MAG: 3-deoxy-7-phosphoheptulonate synthase [Nitrospirae bacterium CG22_combo_CG10-13_8_21_14_all_44_11]PIV40536.1 MAG: 3-deoxy-7-phosphoheptulonate synthase [Nitrospirae bacterium CG02_land_8_20_14_3_00_44_33]PIV66126.1 MAG: 3-deoxy-7-phosphoheptulonate synthase [Nitrospirae bacterium CG01_land_8_20_14_3_00_44_22]PIW88912.1 MAG: 
MDIIVLNRKATEKNIAHLLKKLESKGLKATISRGIEKTVIGVIGDTSRITEEEENAVRVMKGVEDVMRILKPYKLASRDFKAQNTIIKVKGKVIGGKKIPVIAGPCAVENRAIMINIAEKVKAAGASFIRGGAYKPRTSPYSFQGLGEEGLQYLAEAGRKTGLPVVTEIMDPRDLETILQYTDIIQIGARNMQNFRLLLEVGMCSKPVLLKRGLSATIKEWLMAAEYVMSKGNQEVILCERGIRTFETATRNTLDLSAVPVLKQKTHLPVVVDPSHGVGKWDLVAPMAKAAVAVGADGLLIEVHTNPENAMSDGEQSLKPDAFKKLMLELKPIAKAVGREI